MIRLLTPKENETVTLLSEKHLDYIAHPRNDPTSKVDWLATRRILLRVSRGSPTQT